MNKIAIENGLAYIIEGYSTLELRISGPDKDYKNKNYIIKFDEEDSKIKLFVDNVEDKTINFLVDDVGEIAKEDRVKLAFDIILIDMFSDKHNVFIKEDDEYINFQDFKLINEGK